MSEVRITHIGGPTTLIEVGPWRLLTDPTAIPIHYEGWGHFQESQSIIEAAFARACGEVRARLRWVPLGTAVGIPT